MGRLYESDLGTPSRLDLGSIRVAQPMKAARLGYFLPPEGGSPDEPNAVYVCLVIKGSTVSFGGLGGKRPLLKRTLLSMPYYAQSPAGQFARSRTLDSVIEGSGAPSPDIGELAGKARAIAGNSLRRKIDQDFDVKVIHTVRGTGYIVGDAE